MLKPVIRAACACVCVAAIETPSALAQGNRLSGGEIKALVAGATVELDAPLGNKLPVRYTADGHMSGQAGGLASYLGSATDTGKWWVKGDELCHKWKVWFSGDVQCLRLSRQGRTVHWASPDGNSGTATIVAEAQREVPKVETALVARNAPAASPDHRPLTGFEAPSALGNAPLSPPDTDNDTDTRALPPLPTPAPKPARAASQPPAAEPPMRTAQAPQQPPAIRPATKPQPIRQPQPEVQPKVQEPGYIVANVRQDDVLNVRSGPSTEYDVVAALRPGSRGVVITGDCQSDWCPVQHQVASGWVNRSFLISEAVFVSASPPQRDGTPLESRTLVATRNRLSSNDSPEAPRSCLTPAAKQLLQRVEEKFGTVKVVSTCRPGATIAGTGRPSRHASGNAVDFNAGTRKGEILNWLIANHREGGVMTYSGMDHIHIDIGPHFVSIAGGQNWASWRNNVPARGRSSTASTDDDDN